MNEKQTEIFSKYIDRAQTQAEDIYSNLFNDGIDPFEEIAKLDPRVLNFIKADTAHLSALNLRSQLKEI